MKLMLTYAALTISLATLTGCSPSPEKVCNHAVDITSSEVDKMGGKFEKKDRKAALEECIADATKEKAANPDKFKVVAQCALDAKDLEGLLKCEFGGRPKKASDAEKTSAN